MRAKYLPIFNILLDLVGASFSMAGGSLSLSNGLNITKLALAILIIFYDTLFIIKHYILYNPKRQQKRVNNESYKSIVSHDILKNPIIT